MSNQTKLIAPSILAIDFTNLERDISMLNRSQADWLHIDVMDGSFVPNISFGQPIIKAIASITKKPLDVHLMIVNPDMYIPDFLSIGAYSISVHYEACIHLHRTLQTIKDKGKGALAGIALNPHTAIHLLEDIIEDTDLVCLMSVNPGFGGQKFIENTYRRVSYLRNLIDKKELSTLIEVDGGVTTKNAKKLYDLGANVLVSGSSIFNSDNPTQTIIDIKKA